MNRNLERFTRFSEYLLPFLALFSVTFFMYRDFGVRTRFGFAVLCLVLGVHIVRRIGCKIPLKLQRVDLALGMLALVIFLNFLRPDSSRRADTLSYILFMGVCTAFVLLAPTGHSRAGMAVLLAGATAVGIFCLAFTFSKDLFFSVIAPYMTERAQLTLEHFTATGYGIVLGGYAYSGYMLLCGIAVCCALLTQKLLLWQRVTLWTAVGLFFLTLISLGRRGELLAAILACAVIYLALCRPRLRMAILLGGGTLGVAAVVLVIAFLPQLKEIDILYRYVCTIENIINGVDFTSGRMILFSWAVEGFRRAPLFGIGYDQYVTMVAPYYQNVYGEVATDAHNIYLQFLCETGIVGAVLTVLPLGYLLVTTCRVLHHAKGLDDRRPLCFVIPSFMIQFFLLFVGLYDTSFQKIIFWCLYGVAIMLLKDAMALSGYASGILARKI